MRAALLLAFVACSPPPAEPQPLVDPSAIVTELDGATPVFHVTADELLAHTKTASDKRRIYNFWASWCQPCLLEMPRFAALGRERSDIDVWMVNVDTVKAADAKMARIVKQRDIAHLKHMRHASRDTTTDVTSKLRDFPDMLPVTYVVGPTGKHEMTFIGMVSDADLAGALPKGP